MQHWLHDLYSGLHLFLGKPLNEYLTITLSFIVKIKSLTRRAISNDWSRITLSKDIFKKLAIVIENSFQNQMENYILSIKHHVHHELVPQGPMVNKEYYLKVVSHLRKAMKKQIMDLVP